MADFYNVNVLDDFHEFCENGKELNYYNPEEMDMDGYVKFITDKMPNYDDPVVFGLHSNA
jgi:hypothetical protein